MMPDAYVAPAARVLTVLHRPGPPGLLGDRPGPPEPVTGWTAGGEPMLESELWVPVEYREGDSLCPRCFRVPGRAAGDVQEALL